MLTISYDSQGQVDQQLLPIDKIILQNNFVYCQTTNSPMDIPTIIKTAGSEFASGDIIGGIATVVGASLQALVPTSQATLSEDSF